jgi:hypothetical protein
MTFDEAISNLLKQKAGAPRAKPQRRPNPAEFTKEGFNR